MRAPLLRRLLSLGALLLAFAAMVGAGLFGRHEGPGEIIGDAVPGAVIADRAERQRQAREALAVQSTKTILFGDLHTHTTVSMDAFLSSLEQVGGAGSHLQADACDFARYCSALDFWSINDHAEFLTPQRWEETVASIRDCNARAADPANPDTVAFLGWEWTQVGSTPGDHWGHKNVILRGLEDEQIPTHPIAANPTRATDVLDTLGFAARTRMSLAHLGNRRMQDFALYTFETTSARPCPTGLGVRDLPPDCMDSAADPGALFARLRDWGHDALVIPHGNPWGVDTPAGDSLRKQLTARQHDPTLQPLIEVVSGHTDVEACRDCFEPPGHQHPDRFAQYALVTTNFRNRARPLRFRFGFIGSSDVHSARPGAVDDRLGALFDGGLVAIHSRGRLRDQIWAALKRREVYATSGPRTLLWFDLQNPPHQGAPLPMGSEVSMNYTPRFSVRAAGSFHQLPGCPGYATRGLPVQRLQQLCGGECYHPAKRAS